MNDGDNFLYIENVDVHQCYRGGKFYGRDRRILSLYTAARQVKFVALKREKL